MELDGFSDVSGMLRCGVYALCAKGQVLYVGKSKAMLARVYTHRQNWIARTRGRAVPDWLSPVKGIHFDEIHVRPCAPDKLDAVEREMIDKYKPRLNLLLKSQEKITAPINVVIGGVTMVLNAITPAEVRVVRRV